MRRGELPPRQSIATIIDSIVLSTRGKTAHTCGHSSNGIWAFQMLEDFRMDLWTRKERSQRSKAVFRVALYSSWYLMAGALILAPCPALHAQGCIIAHSSDQVMGPETEGGYLAPKH